MSSNQKCAFYTKGCGVPCSRKGKHEWDGMWLCGIHKNVVEKNDECSICLTVLGEAKTIKLSCTHRFHVECLSSCVKRECPLCRHRISPTDCCIIYKDKIIDPLTQWIFTLSEVSQQRIFNTISHITTSNQRSDWLGQNLCNMCERFSQTHITLEQIQTVMQIMESTLKYMEEH